MTRDRALELAVSAWATPDTCDLPQEPRLIAAFAEILFNAVNAPQPVTPQREKGELTPYRVVECPVCHRRVKGITRNGRTYPFRHKSKWHNPCPGFERVVK